MGYGYYIAYITVILRLAMPMSVTGAENVSTPPTQPSIVEVSYDPTRALLAIHAYHMPLEKVLQEIAKQVPLEYRSIDSPNQAVLNEPMSIEIKPLSLELALKKLLEGFNAAILFSSATHTEDSTRASRPIKIILLSKKVTTSLQVKKEGDKEVEREKTVQSSLAILNSHDIRAHNDAIAALKNLGPEKTLASLVHWLQGDDQEMRMAAIRALGHLGDERAIEPLSSALTGNDPALTSVAAASLARIGGETTTTSLLKAYRTGDTGVKHAVVTAIATYGDVHSQKALANLLHVSDFTPRPSQ